MTVTSLSNLSSILSRYSTIVARSYRPLPYIVLQAIPTSTLFTIAAHSFATTRRFFSVHTSSTAEMVHSTDRLGSLRKLMQEHKVDIYIVPSEDAHQSEYIAPCDARRAFISGFTGSAGCAVITSDKASLSTDGRYFNQASKQLDDNWTLLKQGLPDVPTWQEWTCEQSEGGKVVGVDATLITASEAKKLDTEIKEKGGKELIGMDVNLVDEIWGSARPSRPAEPIIVLDVKYAGKAYTDKIEAVRKDLEKKKSPGLILSGLDEIMWLYNIRGSDIPYNPVAFSYAVVTPTEAMLYVDSKQVNEAVEKHLAGNVTIRPYGPIFSDLTELSTTTTAADKDTKKFLLTSTASWALAKSLGGEAKVESVKSPITAAKAVKNDVELEGMRACHIRDGAALIEYFAWLEEQLESGQVLDEVEAADKLEQLRTTKEYFAGLSFPTISSTGANAAVIHYQPEKGACSIVNPNAIYLCDSGAQYYDGTTDTTRTLHYGTPSEMEKKAYTLVLKGNIALSKAVFPKGTSGFALDTLARQFLWAEGLDYRHGTGHGVGSFLNVHEGPIGIGTRIQYSEVPMAAGNVVSNEPGYYEDGSFGIRIENVVLVKEVKTTHNFGDRPYFTFEVVTMVPMCRSLIDETLLTDKEKEWLNDYHKEVLEKTESFFNDDEKTLKWLRRETEAI